MSAANELRADLDERAATLGGVERVEAGQSVEYRVGGRAVCVAGPGGMEVRLGDAIARAATKTPDVSVSPRGTGWVRFSPATLDRFALDRAISWFELAVRGGGSTTAG